MQILKKYSSLVLFILFFGIIFALSITPPDDFDILFHIKAGEAIMKLGIFHHDIFSFSAQGREWYPYEWLFQITVYTIVKLFGLSSLRFFVAFLATATVALFYQLLRSIFKLQRKIAFLISFIFFISVSEFFVARPHLVAYFLLLINLYILLLYVYRNKNYLIVTLITTFIWTNLHGSIILNSYLFWSLTFILAMKRKRWLPVAIFACINTFITILPPLGTLQYRLLSFFLKNGSFISHFIKEWNPLIYTPVTFTTYTIWVFVTLISTVLIAIKHAKKDIAIIFILLFPFVCMPYVAQRNLYLGYMAISLMIGWSISKIQYNHVTSTSKQLIIACIICLILGYGFIFINKKQPTPSYIPKKAIEFIKLHRLTGNMFHEFDFGSYLLYHLYPQQKIFMDIRADLYACCEMRDIYNIALNKNLPEKQFGRMLTQLWNKYHISYVLLSTKRNSVFKKIAEILTNDPSWHLVYWDDMSIIFVKDDNKNKTLLTQFTYKAATPILNKPYRENMADVAFKEYQSMIHVTDSAKSRNTLGYIYLQKKQYGYAQEEFEKAVQLDPTFESPYMNLGELAAARGDYASALVWYQKAKKIAPDRIFIDRRIRELSNMK